MLTAAVRAHMMGAGSEQQVSARFRTGSDRSLCRAVLQYRWRHVFMVGMGKTEKSRP